MVISYWKWLLFFFLTTWIQLLPPPRILALQGTDHDHCMSSPTCSPQLMLLPSSIAARYGWVCTHHDHVILRILLQGHREPTTHESIITRTILGSVPSIWSGYYQQDQRRLVTCHLETPVMSGNDKEQKPCCKRLSREPTRFRLRFHVQFTVL